MKLLLVLILFPSVICSQVIKEDIQSVNTGDTYEIIIRKPINFDSTQSYHLVYFTDAGINSGKRILSLPEKIISHCILVGIAHKGDWKIKRQRDFIPADAGGYRDKDFGQAIKFYSFIKEELFPFINSHYSRQKSKVFIGHSFGGLLAFYMSLKENSLFDYYYALSPSVWANNYELMKIEKNYADSTRHYYSAISIYVGSLEFLNKVLSSSKEFFKTLEARNYTGLSVHYSVIRGVNHYGIVPQVIPEIFKQLN
jgi:hypothetical protein